MVRVDEAGYGQAIFQFAIFNAVTADQHHLGFGHLVDTPLDDLPQDADIHLFERKADQVHGGLGHAAHGIHVAQGIGCGNLAEPIGIIHDGVKKSTV